MFLLPSSLPMHPSCLLPNPHPLSSLSPLCFWFACSLMSLCLVQPCPAPLLSFFFFFPSLLAMTHLVPSFCDNASKFSLLLNPKKEPTKPKSADTNKEQESKQAKLCCCWSFIFLSIPCVPHSLPDYCSQVSVSFLLHWCCLRSHKQLVVLTKHLHIQFWNENCCTHTSNN